MTERYTIFDSIKGIAIIGIMFIHLGQWNNVFSGGQLAVVRSAGLLGVELTDLINAYFYTKSYEKYAVRNEKTYKFVLKQFLRLIPAYYLGLIVYAFSMYLANRDLGASFINVLSHFLFFNGLNAEWWLALWVEQDISVF